MKKLRNKFLEFLKSLSLTTQLFTIISFFFISLILTQSVLSQYMFKDYYVSREYDNISNEISSYIDELNKNDLSSYPKIIQDFTNKNDTSSVLLTTNYTLLDSSEYYITVEKVINGTDKEQYTIIIPSYDYTFTVGELISASIKKYYGDVYSPSSIKKEADENYLFQKSCINCENLTDYTVISVNVPTNINYKFSNNHIVRNEINKIASGQINLENYLYENHNAKFGAFYTANESNYTALIFVHKLNDNTRVMTVYPITKTETILSIINSYNGAVFLLSIIFVLLIGFYASKLITSPIKRIEAEAEKISRLDFTVAPQNYYSHELVSLDNSINRLKNDLNKTIESINIKNGELISLNDRLTEEYNLRKAFVSRLSHELKTPLMVISATAHAFLDDMYNPTEYEEALNSIISEVDKSTNIIKQIIEIYRISGNDNKLNKKKIDLCSLVDQEINKLLPLFKKKVINKVINYKNDSIIINADSNLLGQVISNYLTNAIKYSPDNATVTVNIYKKNKHIIFEVINSDTLINDSELEKIWIPFYRISEESSADSSGIGLYIVSQILTLHKFDFGIENTKNGVKAYFIAKDDEL